jgi:hypothetical protein
MKKHGAFVSGAAALALVYVFGFSGLVSTEYNTSIIGERFIPLPELDKADYNKRMLALAHFSIGTSTVIYDSAASAAAAATAASSTQPLPFVTASTSVSIAGRPWPVAAAYPNADAILPFKRIVAYYGNFYSRGMGVLGEYPTDTMLAMLASTTAMWAAADPTTPVVPAIHYIAAVAQASAGREGKYILRMPDDQIEHALDLANRIHGIVILDVQVAKSTLEYELPQLEKYLKMRNVHLAIDPEFSMKFGNAPGTVIGTFDAADINYAAEYLASIVRANKLPPKILIVHRFTQDMVTNYKNIRPLPEVQFVMDMDGFGSKEKKKGTYSRVIVPEPVQFTGIKIFYKNDTRPPANGLLSPSEVFSLNPIPIYIQYQ